MNSKSVFAFSLLEHFQHLFEPHGGSRAIVLGSFIPKFSSDSVQVYVHECEPQEQMVQDL